VEGDWGLQTKWYHLHCIVISVQSIDLIEGVSDLSEAHRYALQARIDESVNEVDEDAAPVDPDALVRSQWTRSMEPPSTLLMPLLIFQKQGLAWMVHQELESSLLGGILADEMYAYLLAMTEYNTHY
jgi:DNA repair protein RAD16